MQKAYDMKIVETVHGKQLRHISPTLDGDPSGPTHADILDILSSWLKSDQRLFRSATGPGLVSYLNTDNRLKLALSQAVKQDLQKRGPKNVLEALYESGSTATETVQKCIRDIFDVDVFLNPYNLGTLEFRVGQDFSTVSKNPQDAFKQLADYQLIDIQGDGIRSVLGIISAIVSAKKPVILLDEPEAFLHPPQALLLGEIISGLVNTDQQIFIATHSADFLRGLLSTTRDAVIIHLERTANDTHANVLDSETLNQIVTDATQIHQSIYNGFSTCATGCILLHVTINTCNKFFWVGLQLVKYNFDTSRYFPRNLFTLCRHFLQFNPQPIETFDGNLSADFFQNFFAFRFSQVIIFKLTVVICTHSLIHCINLIVVTFLERRRIWDIASFTSFFYMLQEMAVFKIIRS